MRIVTLAIVGLLLFSGCSSDPKPIEPKPTRAPESAAPTLPSNAKSDSVNGRIEFVRHVVRTLNYAVNSGDAVPLQKLFLPSCEGCEKYVAEVKRSNGGRGSISGFEWRLLRGTATDNAVETTINAEPYEKKDPATGAFSRVAPARYELGFRLSRLDDSWVVRDIYRPDEGNER